jgi:hypothetical protein
MFTTVVILLCLTTVNSDIINVSQEKFVAIENGEVHLFEEFGELYHIFNITSVENKLNEVLMDCTTTNRKQTIEDTMDINIIKSNLRQLESHRKQRAINEIGTLYKWITGMPDRDEMNRIMETLNALIEGNNNQNIINHRLEQQLNSISKQNIEKELRIKIKIKYLLSETSKMIQTINLARANILNTELFAIEEIDELIKKEYPIQCFRIQYFQNFKNQSSNRNLYQIPYYY